MRLRQSFFLMSLIFIIFFPLAHNAFADVNKPLPSFSVSTLQPGKKLTNKTFLGKVSLLTVWASWCGYCRQEHGMLMKIKNQVPLYSLSYNDDPESTASFLKRSGNPFILTGIDRNGEVGARLGVNGTPETILIDKRGIIRYEYVGALDEAAWNEIFLPRIKKYQNAK